MFDDILADWRRHIWRLVTLAWSLAVSAHVFSTAWWRKASTKAWDPTRAPRRQIPMVILTGMLFLSKILMASSTKEATLGGWSLWMAGRADTPLHDIMMRVLRWFKNNPNGSARRLKSSKKKRRCSNRTVVGLSSTEGRRCVMPPLLSSW